MHQFPRLTITQRLKTVGAKGAKTLDIYEHRVTIAVEIVVAADAGKTVRGAAADAGKSVRGAVAADDTTGAGAKEAVHVAPAAAISVGQRAP